MKLHFAETSTFDVAVFHWRTVHSCYDPQLQCVFMFLRE